MSEREDGWYWVKPGGHVNFIPAHWDHRGWLVGLSIYEVPIVVQEIGPRIQMPDERPAQEAAPELPVMPLIEELIEWRRKLVEHRHVK